MNTNGAPTLRSAPRTRRGELVRQTRVRSGQDARAAVRFWNQEQKAARERLIYESGNGDVWVLAREPVSKSPAVKHRPNASSGGQTSYLEIGKFLRDGAGGAEHQTLLKLIGTLLDDGGK